MNFSQKSRFNIDLPTALCKLDNPTLCIEKKEREGRFARGFESTCHPPSARAPTRAESNFADSMGGCLYKSSKLEYL